ncbi:MAG: restriction endonuclease subunit S [Deltaproteobacteria bacterium]|nr:restriction endonuclease subunit S [Deltaproteobacteria bacterium]
MSGVPNPSEPFEATEVGNLPLSWNLTRLGHVFDIQQGKALSPSARRGLSPQPFLRTANVLWGRLDLRAVDQMDFTDEEAERLSLQPGDLLVCEGGEIGRTAIWNGEIDGCLYQNHVHRLRSRSADIAPDFVMYWMQAAFLHLRLYGGVGNKTTIPNLSGARLKQLPIPVPPLPEQRAIAAVLSKIQAAVEVQNKIVTMLKELKAATMAKLFREGLRGEPLKQTEIGEIPESWEVRKLGSLAEVSTGTTPATDCADYYVGEVPFVKTAEVDNNIITSSQQCISRQAVQQYSLRIYPAGSVFLAMYGQGKTRGRASLLGIPATTTQNTAAIEPGPAIDREFLWHYLLSQYEALRNTGNLGHLSHLNLGYVKALAIPVPPKEKQIEIREILSLLQHRSQIATEKCDVLRSMFSSMLHLLMTGQVRVNSLRSVEVGR